MSSRVWTLSLFCLAGLVAGGSAYAEGESSPRRATRHAQVQRAVDDDGDRRERVLHEVATRRSVDPEGDAEVARTFREGHAGQAVAHARLARSGDLPGDLRVQVVARLGSAARRQADLRRTRDLRGDRPVLTAYHDYRIRHGNLAPEVYRIAEDGVNERRREYDDERDPRSGSERLETDEDSVRREERTQDREEERVTGRDADEFERGHRGIDDANLERDDEIEREADRLEQEAEAEAARAEESQERDLDREQDANEAQEDREIDRQLQNEEGDLETPGDPGE
ncbi:MAG: hypothetical protein R3F62_11195 [Planctomycetota bacterium]